MDLYGFAGRKLKPLVRIFIENIHKTLKHILSYPSSGHPQPQHVALGASLGITSKASGKSLILRNGHFLIGKLFCLIIKLLKIRLKFF